ncbi:MAG: tetratricopeptide repeat protein [Deltaproteobacteria bacterium]|nr:tetratricopeptide repeat protein [Deltaproteobacteria bacterium]
MNTRIMLRGVGALLIVGAAVAMLNSVWLRAQLGGADSQLKLAYAYGTGNGVEIDQEKAAEWYRRAAEQGDPRGQIALAARYDVGRGVPVDVAAATQWYERSASSGNAIAQFAMAKRFREGKGAPQDNVRSAMWLILSDRYAASLREGAVLLEALRAALSEEQLAEARRIANDWRIAHPGAVISRMQSEQAQEQAETP